MWEASLLYAGGSLDCARLVTHDGYDAAFNVSGGLHHAHRDRAAGFCTVNDCALVAYYLLDQGAERVAYVDIDAHHGDGVQAIFYDDPRVLTLSLHETPASLYPRITGWADEFGQGAGAGFNANLPLLAGTGDTIAIEAFNTAFLPLLRAFNPDYILLQVGADAHFGDPLAHLSLTTHGWLGLAQSVIGLRKPVIALGGGGYSIKTVARLWTLLYGALSGLEFPDDVPAAYAGEWEIPRLHDLHGPPITAAIKRQTQDYAIESVQTVRDLVFPFHGL
jgi:acetoin utilization protein AcuC